MAPRLAKSRVRRRRTLCPRTAFARTPLFSPQPRHWCVTAWVPDCYGAGGWHSAQAGATSMPIVRAGGAMRFSFAYTGIRARDLDATVRFFTQGLGMKEVSRGEIPETGGVVVDLVSEGKEHRLEVNWYPPGSAHDAPYVPGEALDHLYFEMERGTPVEAAIEHLERHGGKLRIAPFAEGGGRIAYVDSPDGHTIEVYERR